MSEVSNSSGDDDSLVSRKFAGGASVCSTASSRRAPRPLNLPAWVMKSSSFTATLSTKGSGTRGNRDQQKQQEKHKGKHSVAKAAPGRTAVTSPYDKTYCAELAEPLFVDLDESLQKPGGGVRQFFAAISHSSLLFSKSWMQDGIFEDKYLGIPSAEWLILSLRVDLVHKADLPVLLELARTCKIDDMVQEAVLRLKWADKFPKVASPTSNLLVRSKDVLKSLLFLARVICALNHLDRFGQMSESPNLVNKVLHCLRVVDGAAEIKAKKKRGRKRNSQDVQNEGSPGDLQANMASTGVKINLSTPTGQKIGVVVDDDDAHQRKNTNSAHPEDADKKRPRINETDNECPSRKKRPSKLRRVSIESTCSTNNEIFDADDLTAVSLMDRFDRLQQYFQEGVGAIHEFRFDYQNHLEGGNADASDSSTNTKMGSARFDRLQQYFQEGVGAIQQLRLDYQKKEEQYKAALNSRIWRNHPERSDEDTSDSNSNTDIRSVHAEEESSSPGLGDTLIIRGTSEWNGTFDGENEDESDASSEQRTGQNAPDLEEKKPDDTDEAMVKRVRSVVRQRIFPTNKFVKGKKQLAKVMKYIAEQGLPNGLDRLGMPFEDWAAHYSAMVGCAFNFLRTDIELAMKHTVDKYLDEHNGSLISVEDIGKLRQSRSLIELNAFTWFWDALLECVAGETTWGEKKHDQLISETVTISDEAYALFLFEHCRDMWIASWQNEKHGFNTEIPLPLYSRLGVDRRNQLRPWNEDGINRFRELCKLVENDRMKDKESKAERRILSMVRKHHGLTSPPPAVI